MGVVRGYSVCFFLGLSAGVGLVLAGATLRESIAQKRYDQVMANGGEVSYVHHGPAFLRERMLVTPEGNDYRNIWYLDGWIAKEGLPWFTVEYDSMSKIEMPDAMRFALFSRDSNFPGLLVNWKATEEKFKSHITITIYEKDTKEFKASYVDINMDGNWDTKVLGSGESFYVWFEDTWHLAEIESEGELTAVLRSPYERLLYFSKDKWIASQ